jgi:hypothetical protein
MYLFDRDLANLQGGEAKKTGQQTLTGSDF